MAKIQTAEAAARLGVTPARVRQLCISGQLPAEKVGTGAHSIWLIEEAVLDKFELPPMGRPKTAKRKSRRKQR